MSVDVKVTNQAMFHAMRDATIQAKKNGANTKQFDAALNKVYTEKKVAFEARKAK